MIKMKIIINNALFFKNVKILIIQWINENFNII